VTVKELEEIIVEAYRMGVGAHSECNNIGPVNESAWKYAETIVNDIIKRREIVIP
jgi:hypothetical protein